MAWEALGQGVVASAWAAAQLFAFIALGACVWKRLPKEVGAQAALLVGSGITAFALAALTATVGVRWTLAAHAGICLAGAAVGWRRGWELLTESAAGLRELMEQWAPLLWFGAMWLGLAWLLAACPPRDADVMRYHLGHIRQIDIEGKWVALPDLHFSFPFGWQFHYLPFEHWGLPQGAHYLNLGVWILAAMALVSACMRLGNARAALVLGGLFVLQPSMLKTGTTAFAEMYLMLAVAVAAILPTIPAEPGRGWWALTGFASWIGAQSRYQAVALGVGASALLVWRVWRKRAAPREIAWFAAGAGAALALSSPFYVMNALRCGNPVWPLMTEAFGNHSYADQAVRLQLALLNGELRAETLAAAVWDLLREPTVFPFPLMAALLLAMAVWKGAGARNAATGLLAVLVGLWIAAQPSLFPKSALMLTPVILLGWSAPLARWLERGSLRRATFAGGCLLLAAFLTAAVVYSADSVRYLATGDLSRYHRATWFYEAYDWANRHTAREARFLVVVHSAQTYYLKRWHRRADPPNGGVVDWCEVRTAAELARVLEEGHYDYLIVQDVDYEGWPGGEEMAAAVREARGSDLFQVVKEFDMELMTLRIQRRSYTTKVAVLVRRGGTVPRRSPE